MERGCASPNWVFTTTEKDVYRYHFVATALRSNTATVLLHLATVVPAGTTLRGGDVVVYVFVINQLSFPSPFYSVLVSVSVCMALWPVVLLSQLNISWLSVLICWRLERNISKRDLCIHSFGTWFRKYFLFLARDLCVLKKMKCEKVMFVWSAFKELCKVFMKNVLQIV